MGAHPIAPLRVEDSKVHVIHVVGKQLGRHLIEGDTLAWPAGEGTLHFRFDMDGLIEVNFR